ncbi:unnamed protein product, partial [Mesorhabditis belari]|uniref:G-protein coupled receptors family 3 profile domain-containing protein n=1 Tax=Mesorhabditis belari TaxID=2138241 RepID=A0AAF3ERS3_9BILA
MLVVCVDGRSERRVPQHPEIPHEERSHGLNVKVKRKQCKQQLLFILILISLPSNGNSLFFGSSSSESKEVENELIPLTFGALFPMESSAGGWAGGPACLPAVEMALEDVNKRQDILPGYRLQMNTSDSKCQTGLSIQQMYQFIYNDPKKLMMMTGCSTVTTVISEIAPEWKLVVLAYGASSPALSNRERFPTLFRTHPSATIQNPTRMRLFEKWKWKKVTILSSVEEVFVSTAKDLEKSCSDKGIRVQRQSFFGDPADAVKTLKRQDARIIVGLFYEADARRVLCQAYKQGVYGRKYVWFFIGWYSNTWHIPPFEEHLNCTSDQMEIAAQYHFTTESLMLSLDSTPGVSGYTGNQFKNRLIERVDSDRSPGEMGGFPEAPLAYDAVWALALALRCTIRALPQNVKIEDFTYKNEAVAGQIFDCMKNTSFQGVSGRVMFSDQGDRIVQTQIEQMQDGKYQLVGYYDMTTKNLTWMGKEKWFGKGPPPDSTIVRQQILTVSIKIYYVVCFFSILGLFMTIGLFIFNRKYGYRSVISQSQPQCNNALLFGSAMCCFALFLMGLPADGLTLPKTIFGAFCHIRISLLMIGFTFAYGSMFAKVWIVHRLGATESQQLANRHKDELKPLLSSYATKEEASPWDSIRTLITGLAGNRAVMGNALRKVSSAAYGNLQAKRSTSNSSMADFLNQPISAIKFYLVIATFLLLDLLIIFFWIIVDPLQRKEQKYPRQEPPPGSKEEDTMIEPVLELCQSSNQEVWIGVVLGYKCILLVFGLFLAYESRKLKLRYINDARFVGLAIYNVAILSLVTGPVVTLLIRTQADANFAFISVTVLLCCYISLGLIFVPKISHIHRFPPTADETEPKMSNGTQRLSTSDKSKYDLVVKDNESLQQKINNTEERIRQCRRRLDLLTNGGEAPSSSADTRGGLSVSEEHTFSSPTTLTTTALIELQPSTISNNNHDTQSTHHTGHFINDEMDNSDSSSDEIFL